MSDKTKPSKNEDEYFAKLDAERVAAAAAAGGRRARDAGASLAPHAVPASAEAISRAAPSTASRSKPARTARAPGSTTVKYRAILAHYDKGLVFRIMDDVMGAFGKKPSPKDDILTVTQTRIHHGRRRRSLQVRYRPSLPRRTSGYAGGRARAQPE